MTAAVDSIRHQPATTCRYGTVDDFDIEDFFDGISTLLGGMANVVLQLSLQPVAYGVMESTVESGRADIHPWKRLRTTLTYIAVALMGSEDERHAYRMEVDRSHRSIRSAPGAESKYNAFDPKLQLWVAGCLYWGMADLHERMHGSLDADTADVFYQYCARLGTTLQMRPDMWPADRAAFEEYWNTNLAAHTIDDRTRDYFNLLIDLKVSKLPIRPLLAPVHRFIVTGLLPPQIREQLGMSWSDADEQLLTRALRMIGTAHGTLPRTARLFPMNALMADMRRRRRAGTSML
ncbi:oxygenase MpaB family protein [Nocardia sp. NPDC055321]